MHRAIERPREDHEVLEQLGRNQIVHVQVRRQHSYTLALPVKTAGICHVGELSLKLNAQGDKFEQWKFFDQFVAGREFPLELFRQGFREAVFSDSHGLGEITQRVLDYQPVPLLAENDPESGLVLRLSDEIVDRGQIEVHLAQRIPA